MLLCWSGGADSTLALWRLAQTSSRAHPLRTIGFTHPQIDSGPSERAARARLLGVFRAWHLHVEHAEVGLRHSGAFGGSQGPHLIHPVLWLTLAIPYLRDDENLALGWCRGDDVWHHIDSVRAAFKGLMAIQGKTGGLVFPLEWEHKHKVLLEVRGLRLLSRVRHCETPTAAGRACGRCDSCKRHAAALREAEL